MSMQYMLRKARRMWVGDWGRMEKHWYAVLVLWVRPSIGTVGSLLMAFRGASVSERTWEQTNMWKYYQQLLINSTSKRSVNFVLKKYRQAIDHLNFSKWIKWVMFYSPKALNTCRSCTTLGVLLNISWSWWRIMLWQLLQPELGPTVPRARWKRWVTEFHCIVT